MPEITFQNDKSFEGSETNTLLELSLQNGIPHVHVCGGMARCSTCRVLVLENGENLTPRNALEQRLADRKGFECNVRLACQTRALGPVTVRRLALDDCDADLAVTDPKGTTGREAGLAVMFSDIRDFTTFSESHLPYDTIHLLNRYFYQMGDAILHNHGYIDKYMGDGIMALFGINGGTAAENCHNAVAAALQMLSELDKLNLYLKKYFNVEFKTGIGIHYGEAVLGELGHPERRQLTVIGDTVNMASRIESSTKTCGVPLLISDAVKNNLKELVETGRVFQASLKGKSGTYDLHEVVFLHSMSEDPKNPEAALVRKLSKALLPVVTRQRAPVFLKLAFHDAGTYSQSTGQGGPNGSIRLPVELARVESKGLSIAVDALKPIKAQFPDVSWADLIALSGALAVKRTGGPDIHVPLGRKDSDVPSPDGLMAPMAQMDAEELLARFTDMGLTMQELIALSGAHTLGRVYGTPFTDDWFSFSNSYFKVLLKGSEATLHMLPSDRVLVQYPPARKLVEKYAMDQDAFFHDFAAAYTKMTTLGTGLAP